jgi:hypothetical protein
MRNFLITLSIFVISLYGCATKSIDYQSILDKIDKQISAGNLSVSIALADSLKKTCSDRVILRKADSLEQIARRIPLDFSLTGEKITANLVKRLGKYSPEDQKRWEDSGWLEWRIIDGEKRYFNRAVSNLVLIKNFNLDKANSDSLTAKDAYITFRKKHTESIIQSSGKKAFPSVPVEMEITYTITVNADAVPDGETVRCWMPYPKESHSRQTDVYLLGVSDDEYFLLAPDSVTHRSIYMETKAKKGVPVIFREAFTYKSAGQYFDPAGIKSVPYDKNSKLYRKYTAEQLPQICFTDRIKHLADSITGAETNPYEIVRKIYYWINNNIPWAGALEYSVMPNIPEYVLLNRRGDCGMQTFLLMSMLRYKGIPVKWQSGWMMPPDNKNLHDWCEVYFEGTGWVPVDISFGLQYSSSVKTRDFYVSGIDSYRLIVNDGVSGALYPAKKFMRSEPYDFQRGEVEWSGGNLYFDKWDYTMQIIYK